MYSVKLTKIELAHLLTVLSCMAEQDRQRCKDMTDGTGVAGFWGDQIEQSENLMTKLKRLATTGATTCSP